MENLLKYENELKQEGFKIIGGTDEAGRGPLFGPVVASCVVLKDDFDIKGINDSKKLSEKKREEYYDYIMENSIVGISIISNEVIDEINIYEASRKAMMEAISEVQKKVNLEYVLTDAMKLPDLNIPHLPIIKGDSKSASIAAASIIAKVTRDRIMYDYDKKYPEYEFGKHKGYPTKRHIELLNKYGLIDGYRLTYGPAKKILGGDSNATKELSKQC